MERPCQSRPPAERPTPAAGPHGGLHRRKGRRPHATSHSPHHVRRFRGTETGSRPPWKDKGGQWGSRARRGMAGQASEARLTMVPKRWPRTLLPHNSRPGSEGREAGCDATRSAAGGGASSGVPLRLRAARGGREGSGDVNLLFTLGGGAPAPPRPLRLQLLVLRKGRA